MCTGDDTEDLGDRVRCVCVQVIQTDDLYYGVRCEMRADDDTEDLGDGVRCVQVIQSENLYDGTRCDVCR